VRDGEARHELGHATERRRDEQHCEQEREVVEAGEDVLDPEPQERRRALLAVSPRETVKRSRPARATCCSAEPPATARARWVWPCGSDARKPSAATAASMCLGITRGTARRPPGAGVGDEAREGTAAFPMRIRAGERRRGPAMRASSRCGLA
jgi:hypothetical protein